VLTRGTRSGSTVAVNGTSVAAPKVAHEAWRLMQSKSYADRPDIRDIDHATPQISERRGGDGALVVAPVAPPAGIRR
jgi:hypothetical protein